MVTTWRNWAGLVESRPREVVRPRTPDQVAAAVRDARSRGLRVKMPGSGHSFTDIAAADEMMLDPTLLAGVTAVDRTAMTVTALAGTTLGELNQALERLGLALHNMGDIDRQTVAGAVSTGTHGTGGVTASLSGQLVAVELVTGEGEVVRCSAAEQPELFSAARVGLGAVGVLTRLTFAVEPAFVLAAWEGPLSFDEATATHDELVAEHHHVDLYWFPHTERCLAKVNDRTLDDPAPLSRLRARIDDELLANTVFGVVDRVCTRWPRLTRPVAGVTSRALGERSYRDLSHRVFVSPRRVVFKEMEYALPREAGMAALREVKALLDRSAWDVVFPVEVRATPPDEAWLSTSYGRDSVYLAFHVGRGADHRDYFTAVEEVMVAHGGRPHWGKLHTRGAADLAGAYPRWAEFHAVRDRLDPDGLFGNAYLDRVLG